MNEIIYKFVLVAALVEVLVEIIKPLYAWLEQVLGSLKADIEMDIVAAIAIATAFAFGAQMNILEVFGISLDWPVIGYVITGLLMSKGSNFLHDFFETFSVKGLIDKFKKA